MKNISLFLLVFAFIFSACKKEEAVVLVDCVPTGLQSNLIAFYPFSNGSIEDKSNFNNDLTNSTQAIATSDRDGNLNCAYSFDNRGTTEQFLTTTQTDFLNNLSTFSVSLWYQPIDNTISGADLQGLVVRKDYSGGNPNKFGEWYVGLYDCRRALLGHDNAVWANNTYADCQDEIDFLTDKWHHVVAVKSGDNYKLYFNGTLDDTASGDAIWSAIYNTPAEDRGDLFLGKLYNGDIDDVMIFNKELSQQEVTELFNLETCCD